MGWKSTPKPIVLIAFLFLLPALSGLAQAPQGKKPREPWPVPEKFKGVQNPVPAAPESIEAGKLVFVKECLTCHGPTGVGDGPQAKDLEVEVGNLRRDIANQTDGELYYKISKGKTPMPEFIKTLQPEERWHAINYVRTLQASPAKWVAPDEFKNQQNPAVADAPSIDKGRELYATHCLSCHGATGAGEGEEAKNEKRPPGDLRTELTQRTDGELFWKLTQGHAPTPDFGKKLDEPSWWHVVNYLRTLERKTARNNAP
jgi:mono/diheme cytochrome c family protein